MKIIYKQQDLIDLFDDISPFNMEKDVRFLIKKHMSIDKVITEIEATLFHKNYHVIYEKIKCGKDKKQTVLIKVRIKNPQSNRGKSSGFRVIAIVNECEDYALVLKIFSKTGSKRKDDLSDAEMSKAKNMYLELIEEENDYE